MEASYFLADAFGPAAKADLASMEYPLFALRPTTAPFRYQHGDYVVDIRSGPHGRATIHDKDIWIFCISQLISAADAGRRVDRTVRFCASDFLRVARRGDSGDSYQRMFEALIRLQETSVFTNLVTAKRREHSAFGLLDSFRLVSNERNRTIAVEVTLPDWLWRSIQTASVLTLHADYFGLRSPIERRLYELGRKHCGTKIKFSIGLSLLCGKVGSCSSLKEFRRQVIDLERRSRMPQYRIRYDKARDMVIYYARSPEGNKACSQDMLTSICKKPRS